MDKKLVVVADDFTGANDTGVQFRKSGAKVNVILDVTDLDEALKACDILVADLETRLVTPEEAYIKNFTVGKQLSALGNCIIYKKIDSTFRGNIGAEIDGLMDSTCAKITFLAAALPIHGRTIENGVVYVNKQILTETEFSNDPRNPVKHSSVANIIGLQSKRICCIVEPGFFDWLPEKRKKFIIDQIDNGSEIFVFDGCEEIDLANVARFISSINFTTFLLAGSAGLAAHLSPHSLVSNIPLNFVFAGSTSERTRQQILHARLHESLMVIEIASNKLLSQTDQSENIIQTVFRGIKEGKKSFILTSALHQENVDQLATIAALQSLTSNQAARLISIEMGKLAAILIRKFNPSVVVLTGGETAINTIIALGATGIEIDRELLPGIQSGWLTGCSIKSVIVTKAGGFGQPDAITKIIELFK